MNSYTTKPQSQELTPESTERRQNQQQSANDYKEQEYQIEDIYEGLLNMQKNKTLIIMGKIIAAKIQYIKMLGFKKLNIQPKPYQIKKTNFNHLHNLLIHCAKNRSIWSKSQAFLRLKQNLKNQRIKQIKIFYLLARKYINIKVNSFKNIFAIWNNNAKDNKHFRIHQLQAQQQQKLSIKKGDQTMKFMMAKRMISGKLLASLLRQKIYFIFFKIKQIKRYSGNKLSKLNQDIQNIYKPSFSNSYNKNRQNTQNSLLAGTSYSKQMINSKKMAKSSQKTAQYKIEQRKLSKICINFKMVFRKIILKKYKYLFNKLLIFSRNNEDNDKFQIPQLHKINEDIILKQKSRNVVKDSTEIIENMLKHICWISSKEATKRQSHKQKKRELIKSVKLRVLLLKLKRKQNINLKRSIRIWSQKTLTCKLQICNKIKQLVHLKQSFVQSYK